ILHRHHGRPPGDIGTGRPAPPSGVVIESMAIVARPASIAQRLLPVLGWLPGYKREWLLPDVLAGLAVWAVMVPEGMAYAGLVGVTIIGQVPHLLGIEGTSGNFFVKLWSAWQHLPDALLTPVLTGLLSLIAMLLLRHLAPRVPAALVVAVVTTILVGLLGGEAAGVSVVGELPSGLPQLALPKLDIAILKELAPGALAIVLVGYAEALGAAKAAVMQDGGDIDPNQELIAHGPANILSGLFGGFLVVGSLSKTSVAMAAGAHTQLANLVAAVFCFLTLVFLTPLFRGMPHPALAAIVIAAMLHLSRPEYLRDLVVRSRWEFALAAIVIAGELAL